MDLRYDPGKLTFGLGGHVYYDGKDVAPDLETFLKNAHNVFPPASLNVKPANQITGSTVAAPNHDSFVNFQSHPESCSGDSDQRKSSSDSAKSITFAPALG
jgi:hypothetical protein